MQAFLSGSEIIRIPVCAGYFNGDILFDINGLPAELGAVPDFVANSFAILTRGAPTRPATELIKRLGYNERDISYSPLALMSATPPDWRETILGNTQGDNPALQFFEEIIPQYLGEWQFIQKLIVPEYPLFSKLGAPQKLLTEANSERVDFYLPQADLVIEIDGRQHNEAGQMGKDKSRDRFLERHGIQTLRLKTSDLRHKNGSFNEFITRLCQRCEESPRIQLYKNAELTGQLLIPSPRYTLTAIIRLQIAIIFSVACGCLDLSAREWDLNVTQDFPQSEGIDWVSLAIEELFSWFKLFARLSHAQFITPKVNFRKRGLHFAMRLFQRADDNTCKESGIIICTNPVQSHPFHIDTVTPSKIVRLRCLGQSHLTTNVLPKPDPLLLPAVEDLVELNHRVFGHSSFRPGQETLIFNAISGQKSLGLMPTGGGKSLCFQIPALLSQGITLVVVPIKALGRDHCAELEAVGFTGRVVNIDSDMSAPMREKIYTQRILNGEMRFVFVSPERFQTEGFRNVIRRLREANLLRMFVIDEVHCMSEWGHDFRPSYLTLPGTLRKLANDVPVLGLTATASVNVLRDIQSEFQIPDDLVAYEMHRSRTELNFSIRQAQSGTVDVVREVAEIVSEKDSTNPPIHIFSRYANGTQGVETLSNALAAAELDLNVGFFSGSTPRNFNYGNAYRISRCGKAPITGNYDNYKKNVQTYWKKGKLDVIVTTKAFGMGVNKPDVRHTLHAGMPGSMEAFYQEAGRAGRDRIPSFCHMLFRPEPDDAEQIWLRIQSNLTPEAIENEISTHSARSRGDFRAQLWFLKQNLISLMEEHALVTQLHLIIRESPQESMVIHVKQISDAAHNGLRFQLTLYRLYQMGLIEPWTVTDWGRAQGDELSVQAVEVRRLNTPFSSACAAVMIRIQSVDGKGVESAAIEKINSLAEKSEDWSGLYHLLLEWVRRTQLGSRLQSTWNLYNACLNFTPDSAVAFRDTLESFFKVDSNAFRLASLRDMTLDEAALTLNTLISLKGSKELLDVFSLKKLTAQLARLLEGTQESRGLNLAAACLQLLTEKSPGPEAHMRFRHAIPDGALAFWKGSGRVLLTRIADNSSSARETIGSWLLADKPDRQVLLHIYNELPATVIEAALFKEVATDLAEII